MDIALIWVIAGVVLILSELLATSIVALFFGLSAIVVGLLLWAGVIDSIEMQFFIFAALSLAMLFTARSKLRRYLVGDLADSTDQHQTFRENLGQHATAVADFHQGMGRVLLNGVQWSAQSDDEIISNDRVWIIANDGIQLTVSKTKPVTSSKG